MSIRKVRVLATKDVRHVWRLLCVALPLMFLFAMTDIQRVVLHKSVLAATMWQLLYLATPLAVWGFVAALIHAEPLVGDRQYWLTRPFTWQDLTAAKGLVVLACIHLPLLVFQGISLAARGISPLPYLPDLLWRQVFFLVFLVLPAVALAAVTRTQGQFALSLLLAASPFAALAWFDWDIPQWTEAIAVAAVLVVGTTIVLLLQYARRRASWSRAILAATVASCLVLVAFDGNVLNALSRSGQTLHLTLDPFPVKQIERWRFNRPTAIELPVIAEGMPDGQDPALRDYRIVVETSDAPGGRADVNSVHLIGWRGNRGEVQILLSPESTRRLFRRVLSVRGEIYLTLMKRVNVLNTGPDMVPIDGFGVCTRSRALCLSPRPRAALSLVPSQERTDPDQFGRIVPPSDTFSPFPYVPTFYPMESYHYEPSYGVLLVERPAGQYRCKFAFDGVRLE